MPAAFPDSPLEVRVKRLVVPSVFLILLCLSSVPAHAQERGQAGVAVWVPSGIGFIWHASDGVAVRPELAFSFGSSQTSTPAGEIDSDGGALSIGTSVLFYKGGTDTVRTYLAPRLVYTRTSFGDDEAIDGVAVSGSFGAQYTPARRFAVFGEAGLEYARRATTLDAGFGEFELRSSSVSTRAAVGVILYLGGN